MKFVAKNNPVSICEIIGFFTVLIGSFLIGIPLASHILDVVILFYHK